QDEYLKSIKESGFGNIEIKKTKTIVLPDELLLKYLSKEEIENYKRKIKGIYSITVTGYKN
ncbi:MAG TPA: hypothetical protein VKD08_01960, partial [Ignavibacteriaceae bacterium]|nr:hypothetical protein [Ignavibacteriaceae bacterium]